MSKKSLKLLLTSSLLAVSAVAPLNIASINADEVSRTTLEEIKAKQAETQSAMNNVSSRLAEAQARANAIMLSQQETTKEIEALKQKINQKSMEIEKRQSKLEQQARMMQSKRLNKALVEFVFGGKDFQEVISRLRIVTNLLNANSHLVSEQKQDQQQLEQDKVQLEQKLALQQKNAYELESLKDSLSNEYLALNERSQNLSKQEAEEVQRRIAAEQAAQAAREAEEARRIAEERAAKEAEEKAAEEARALVRATEQAHAAQQVQAAEEVATPQTYTAPIATPVAPVQSAPVAPSTTGGVLGIAQQYIGTPYVWGGSNPNSGFDCSGFVQYVYAQMGINLPRVTYNMEHAGTYISVSEAQPGDLLFWGAQGSSYHVAIYMGNGQYIDAPQPGGTVGIRSNSWSAPSFAVRL
ncbi:NlpC/P60 family protein [Atopobacter phocae]|uniref:C40 family peptidase n=1 Tax=Atopobacter phocae TaxID=136492 RepID=UPI00046FE216|nr:C40 family peptidase [Atopobacter phocae]